MTTSYSISMEDRNFFTQILHIVADLTVMLLNLVELT